MIEAAITIRPERAGDHAAIRSVVGEAFGGAQEAHLVDDLRSGGALAVSLVAEHKGRICGHVALSWLRSPPHALALAPLAVSRDHQRRGIGSTLVHGAIDLAQQQDAKIIFVLGDPGYYKRFGFSAEVAAPFPSPYAGPHFMARRLTANEAAIAPVIYADAFNRLV